MSNIKEFMYMSIKPQRKWQKRNLVSRGRLCGSQLGRAANWLDQLRTSADERL